ncbi:MAG: hypothetical protein IKO56_01160 [Alphaproteobacteria bacterium]|nr:hypothetical protein [Alphaproteobacteria bacterium]
MTQPLLSICIPTNGIPELIFPVLDSIFVQTEVAQDLYEVVVMDNGNNQIFKQQMTDYAAKHDNLIYKQTDAHEFLSESECYKAAKGLFIKFINHRTKLLTGTLQYFVDFVRENEKERPSVYFSNGVIKDIKGIAEYDSFDGYVKGLSYWSSWSTGMGFWKDDFDKIPKDAEFNILFPHTTILFNERHKNKYIIDNIPHLYEIPISHANKGRYNLFYAFGVEYVGLICDLYRESAITAETFLKVKKDNLRFIAGLYRDFVLNKDKCSYDLSGMDETLNVFYSLKTVKSMARKLLLRGCAGKVYRKIFKSK